MSARIAVVLSGCGYLDGAEVQEAVLTLYFLERAGFEVQCFAPDRDQMHVVDHQSGEVVEGERRNVLRESARICRGGVKALKGASIEDYAALVMPGGFGVAKNLSNFALAGTEAEVDPDLEKLIGEAKAASKPIVAICIAPAILALALKQGESSATLTVGSDDDPAAGAVRGLGSTHQACPVEEAVIDEEAKVISTPAYMLGPGPKGVGAGIEQAISKLASWLGA